MPILIVEDDKNLRTDLAALLELEGYQVVAASNGAEALEWLGSGNRPCMILLDLMMPIMDGWEFRSAQLLNTKLADIPVVLMSGTNDLPQHAISLNPAGYLAKPFEFDQMMQFVQHYCS